MLQLAQILDFADSRHVQSILELADFDFLDSDLPSCRRLPSCNRPLRNAMLLQGR
jgi:hypothetical protein